jgi:diguanylate cyclase (GGDEF)-like protein
MQAAIEDVLAPPDGTVWAGATENLYRWNGERFVPAAPQPIHIWRSGRFIYESPGHLLVAEGERLFRLSYRPDGSFVSYLPYLPAAVEAGLQSGEKLGALTLLPDRTLWFGCAPGLCSWSGGKLIRWGAAKGVPEEFCYSIRSDRGGSIWAVMGRRVIELSAGASRFVDRSPPGSEENGVYHRQPLVLDPAGGVLVSGKDGVARWDGHSWHVVGSGSGLRASHIISMVFDRDGDLWLGSAGRGLYHWIGYGNWEGWTELQGLPSAGIWSLGPFPGGQVYAGTETGPATVDLSTGAVRPLFDSSLWSYGQVGGIVQDSTGLIWAGTKSGAVLRIQPSTHRVQSMATIPSVILGMIQDSSGRILALTKKGLYGFDPSARHFAIERIKQVDTLMGGAQRISNACSVPGSDTLWFSATRGVLQLRGSQWNHVPIDGLNDPNPGWTGISCAPDGTFWLLGRESGVRHLQLKNGRLQVLDFHIPDEFRSVLVVAIAAGDSGLWLGTDNGLLAWNGSSWRHLTQESGLVWNDINSQVLAFAPDGSLWIGTSGGLGHLIRPADVFRPSQIPISIIDIHHGAEAVTARSDLSFPWSRQEISFYYAAPNSLDRSDLKFHYRMWRLDSAWVETKDTTAHFSGLPAGDYRFEVFATNTARNAASPTVTFSFRILPPWWRTYWFYGSCAAAAVLALIFVYRLRTEHLLHQKRRLEQLVQERTTELEASREELRIQATHDALTGLLNRAAILEILTCEIQRARREKSSLTIVLADVDHFKRVNDTFGHQAGDAALRRFGDAIYRAVRNYDHAGRYGGEEFLLLLPGVSSSEAASRLASLHAEISGLHLRHRDEEFQISCSLGASSIDTYHWRNETDDFVQYLALAAADQALYEAKESGRNRYIHRDLEHFTPSADILLK